MSATTPSPPPAAAETDRFDSRHALAAGGLLAQFNLGGVLAAADVHVAGRLLYLAEVEDEAVALAVALAVRAPRIGHVHVDLATIAQTAAVDGDEPIDLTALPWPEATEWPQRLAACPTLVTTGEEVSGEPRPLRLLGSRLYLDRYWALERQLAGDLVAKAEHPPAAVDPDVLAGGIGRLFADQLDSRQCQAAACAVLSRLAVVAGGPGTGKTTTVARIVALLDAQAAAAGHRPPLVALCAPTGKAAARLEEAVHAEAQTLAVEPAERERLLGLRAQTIHRLLGWRPGSHSRFRHDREQRLAHDVVVVDETSMVSLSLMARLLEAIRPDARLVLVGDPGQLASIEAGAVLGDIVGPATESLRLSPSRLAELTELTGRLVAAEQPPPGAAIADGIVVLDRVHRYGDGIGRLATAIRHGDGDAVLELLADPPPEVSWIDVDIADPDAREALAPVRAAAVESATALVNAAAAGATREALGALGAFRILCAHRRGPQGVATWTSRIEGWLADALPGFSAAEAFYVGRPLLVTENDYELRLFNGDSGVVVRDGDEHVSAVFERRGALVSYSPARLGSVQTVFAMTIHKSQGSQFDTAAVLLPAVSSPILTRELLYTAVTRARQRVILAGTRETVLRAVERPVARASGLRGRLWGEDA